MSNQSSLIACFTRTTKNNDISCKFHSTCRITPAASNWLLQASQWTSLVAHSKCGHALQKKSQTPNKILLKLLLTENSTLQTLFTAGYFRYLIQKKNKQILEEHNEIFCCKLGKWRVMIKEFPPRIHNMKSWESIFFKIFWRSIDLPGSLGLRPSPFGLPDHFPSHALLLSELMKPL